MPRSPMIATYPPAGARRIARTLPMPGTWRDQTISHPPVEANQQSVLRRGNQLVGHGAGHADHRVGCIGAGQPSLPRQRARHVDELATGRVRLEHRQPVVGEHEESIVRGNRECGSTWCGFRLGPGRGRVPHRLHVEHPEGASAVRIEQEAPGGRPEIDIRPVFAIFEHDSCGDTGQRSALDPAAPHRLDTGVVLGVERVERIGCELIGDRTRRSPGGSDVSTQAKVIAPSPSKSS